MRQTVCDVTKAVIPTGENVGEIPMVVTLAGTDVELVVVARCRPDGSRPDLLPRAIRVMVERGQLRVAPELPHLHLVADAPKALPHRRGA